MNYILIKYGEDETCAIDVFRTEESRELGTMLSIFGELVADNPEWNAHLQTLKRDRRIYFEGDPGVEWLDATDVSSVDADGTLHDITDLYARLTTATHELAEARRELALMTAARDRVVLVALKQAAEHAISS